MRKRIWRNLKYPLLIGRERTLILVALILVIVIGVIFAGLMTRKAEQARLKETTEMATPFR
ncbi:MAG TPA: hypothetical protein VIS74_05855 [Chthoniobacterales bacterium]